MLRRAGKNQQFSKKGLCNRKGNDGRKQPNTSASGRGRSRRDPALTDRDAGQVMLAHCLGCFCCFYVNGAPNTPQLFSLPAAMWKKFTGVSPLSPWNNFFRIQPSTQGLFSCWKWVHKFFDQFQYGQQHYKPPTTQVSQGSKEGKNWQQRWEHQPWVTASYSASLIDAFPPSPENSLSFVGL